MLCAGQDSSITWTVHPSYLTSPEDVLAAINSGSSNPARDLRSLYAPTKMALGSAHVLYWCVGQDSNLRSPMGDRFTVCCI